MTWDYIDYNGLPYFGNTYLSKIDKNIIGSTEGKIAKINSVNNGQPTYKEVVISFYESFLFQAVEGGYQLKAISNELIGCPSTLCIMPTIDAANYDMKSKVAELYRGHFLWEVKGVPNKSAFKIFPEPDINKAMYIFDKYPGVPNVVDAVSQIEFQDETGQPDYRTFFVKDNFVFVFGFGFALEFLCSDMFNLQLGQENNFFDEIINLKSYIAIVQKGKASLFC